MDEPVTRQWRARYAPKLSVGLPVFNGENFLEEALESVRAQSFDDFELIIADNASDDRTGVICESYASKDERIRLIRNPTNVGGARNHNLVLAHARAPCFKWMAHDDVCEPTFFDRCVEALDQTPAAVGAYPRALDIDQEGIVVGKWPPRRALAAAQPQVRFSEVLRTQKEPLPIFGVLRTHVVQSLGGLGAYPSSDRVLICAMALRGPLLEVPEFLFLHREHPQRSVYTHGWREHAVGWWDPQRAGKLTFVYWRVLGELLRTVWRAPLDPGERRRCYGVVGGWVTDDWNWLKLCYDLAVPARPLLLRLWRFLSPGRPPLRADPVEPSHRTPRRDGA